MVPKMADAHTVHVAPGAAAGAPTFRAAVLVDGFAWQTLVKWPFFEHAEQIASLAGWTGTRVLRLAAIYTQRRLRTDGCRRIHLRAEESQDQPWGQPKR